MALWKGFSYDNKKWEPDNFELEMNTVWSFPKRGTGLLTMRNIVETGHPIYHEIFC